MEPHIATAAEASQHYTGCGPVSIVQELSSGRPSCHNSSSIALQTVMLRQYDACTWAGPYLAPVAEVSAALLCRLCC